jgi:hypothetical protein
MSEGGRQHVRILLLRLLLGASFLAGTVLTWSTAWIGFTTAFQPTCRRPKLSTAKMRVKAAREAVTQYMIETPRCPHGVDELVAGKYLDKGNAKDPWGSEMELICPGNQDTAGADVRSPGPDRRLGTADDVNSWDL